VRARYTWRYRGDAALACISLFEYQAQVWCRLPDTLVQAPQVNTVGNKGQSGDPVNFRVVDGAWLVISSADGPFELDAAFDGHDVHGQLEHQHHGE